MTPHVGRTFSSRRTWRMRPITLVVAVWTTMCVCVSGFYLPGIAPNDFMINSPVEIHVNSLDSVDTQMPYDYYSLPWTEPCRPSNIVVETENLGEMLSGDRIETSLYSASMRIVESCKILCRTNPLTNAQVKEFASKIEDNYRINLLVDGLPAAEPRFVSIVDSKGNTEVRKVYQKGFALGYVDKTDPKTKYINNHVRLTLYYHVHKKEQGAKIQRIVGVEARPFSVAHQVMEDKWDSYDIHSNRLDSCTSLHPVSKDSPPQRITGLKKVKSERSIIFTYDIEWIESDVRWASRWDIYLTGTSDTSNIRWLSIVNSLMVVLVLAMLVAMAVLRTVHKDIKHYNSRRSSADEEEGTSGEAEVEELGWKLIYADVFRAPHRAGTLCVFIGTGVQLFFAFIAILVFCMTGFLSPTHRGSLIVAMLLLYVMMGVISGYTSTRLFRTMGFDDWRTNTLQTAFFFPFVCFSIFFILDLILWAAGSSGAVTMATLLSLLILWLGISAPLVYFGSWNAFKHGPVSLPIYVQTQTQQSSAPRPIPKPKSWFLQHDYYMLLGGLLPFSAVAFEVNAILSSVWLHQYYYLFSFLSIVFIILMFTCMEVSILATYYLLREEDYRWWWNAFLVAGSTGLYLYGFSAVYFFTGLQIIKLIPGLLYFSYMALVSFTVFIVTGTMGLAGAMAFVYYIYSAVKID